MSSQHPGASTAAAAYRDDAIGGAHGNASESQHLAAIVGERDVRAIALEQSHAEVFLELAQLNAQSGLSDGATLGGASEVQAVGQSEEVT